MRVYTGYWSISSAVPVSGRAEFPVSRGVEFQSVEELVEEWNFHVAEERNFQSVKEWWCGDKGGRVAGPFQLSETLEARYSNIGTNI